MRIREPFAYPAAVRGLIMGLIVAAPLPAGAACPSHEKVSAMIRAWEALEPVRGLRTDLSMQDAECGQRRLVQKLTLALGPVVGYKAGLTNPAVQKRYGVTAPLRGTLLKRMLLQEGEEVPARFGARPVFEADLLVAVRDSGIHRARTRVEALKSLPERIAGGESDTITHWFAEDAAAAGIGGNLHRLRHTFCAHLAMAGVPLRRIQILAGHADYKTTERYAHLCPQDAGAEVNKIGL